MRRVITAVAVAGVVAAAAAGCGSSKSGATATPPVAPYPTQTPGSTSLLPTPDAKDAAADAFTAEVKKIGSRDTVKSSWRPGCPVPLSGLRLIEMTYWGMDDKPHPGQLVVNASAADDVVKVFGKLYDMRYPIRRMELVDEYKGDDFASIEADNTSAFNCRNATGSSSWSQHAYGLAIDINPCENPYVHSNGHIEHPRCVKYGNRSRTDPGLVHAGDKVVRAFASIGWGWGGSWPGTKDFQHFSRSGR